MHSSRMRTGRSLTVCCSLLPGGGGGVCLVWGEVVSAWSGGVLPAWGGPPCSGGSPCSWGGCLPGPGGSACSGGGSAWSQGGGVHPARGVCLFGGGLPARGVCLVPGGVLLRDPPVNRITDTCKNITLATTSLRPVINKILCFNRKC